MMFEKVKSKVKGGQHGLPKGVFLTLSVSLVVTLGFVGGVSGKMQHDPSTPMPNFSEPIDNITVIKGRDITFTCVVKHLGQYKVGWVKADTKAIQAIHHQVVTHNPRVSVTYRDRTTWNLHIRNVQEDDRGVYMCQVNTDPMIAEMAYLEVTVPPEIDDTETSGETEVEEGGSVNLVCKARGYPTPLVSWKRENGVDIILRDRDIKAVPKMEGDQLSLTRVKRTDMGPYLCIAKNGIPPSVSKRIMLRVNFPPTIEVPEHMIGSPLGSSVVIKCVIQSFPRSVNTWRREPGEQMIISSHKYNVSEEHEGYYITRMTLTILNFSKEDASRFRCVASNSLGASDSAVQVYEIQPQKPIHKEKDDSRQENHIPKVPESDHKNKLAFNNDVNDNEIETYVDPPGRLPPKGSAKESQTKEKDSPKKSSSGGFGILFFDSSRSSKLVEVSKGSLTLGLLLCLLARLLLPTLL